MHGEIRVMPQNGSLKVAKLLYILVPSLGFGGSDLSKKQISSSSCHKQQHHKIQTRFRGSCDLDCCHTYSMQSAFANVKIRHDVFCIECCWQPTLSLHNDFRHSKVIPRFTMSKLHCICMCEQQGQGHFKHACIFNCSTSWTTQQS